MKSLLAHRSRAGFLAGSVILIWVLGGCSTGGPSGASVTKVQNSPSVTNAATTVTPSPLPTDTSAGWKAITNNAFGLTLQMPADWYGPDVYEWDQGVRIEVGSDKVYPYGTDPADRTYTLKNSYYVVIQYTKNYANLSLEQYRQSQPWVNTYLSLLALKDGQSLSGPRDLVTRVRSLEQGRFEGLEYISTLPPSAQTDLLYIRQAVLLDKTLNALTVMGTPNNVVVKERAAWQDAYRQVDEANADVFRRILESIAIR